MSQQPRNTRFDRALVIADTVAGLNGVRMHYAAFAQLDSVVQLGQPTRANVLGARGRVDQAKTVIGVTTRTTTLAYDSRYRVTSVTDPGIHVVTYYYNATFGSTDSVQTPGARMTRTRYDGMGRDTASNAGVQKWVRQQRDVLNRITKAIGDTGTGVATPDTTLYTYTENLRRTAVRDPIGDTWTYDANALGVLTQVTDPAGNLDKYFVDALGRVTVWRNRRDDSTYTVYDNLSRVLRRTVRTRTGGTLNTTRA